VAFVFAFATLVGAVGALGWAIYQALDDGESVTATEPGLEPGETPAAGGSSDPLTYWLDGVSFTPGPGLLLQAAVTRAGADLIFSAPEGEGIEFARHFAAVTDLYAGIDGLELHELRALMRGEAAEWTAIGGLGGTVVPAVVESDAGVVAELLGIDELTGARRYATYDDLISAMAPGSGLVAVVPLTAVHPSVRAVAIGERDIVRGMGDLDTWPLTQRLAVQTQSRRARSVVQVIVQGLDEPIPQATTVVATGDILISRCSLAHIEASGDWGSPLRNPMGDFLRSADLTLGSLDGAIHDINPAYRCVANTNLSSPPQVIEALLLGGFDVITIATNHIFDCGVEFCGDRAFLRTIELLEGAGIRTVGGGANLEAALAPEIVTVNGIRFGVLGFDDVAAMDLEATATTSGTAPLDDSYEEERAAGEPAFFRPASELSLNRFTERIRRLKQQADVVIVQVQSGTEDTHTPSPRSLKALRAAVDAGADLVIGNQAHWVQAIEPRGDAFIAYALGNFIFDQLHTPEHSQGYVVEATFWGPKLVNVRLLPYEIIDLHKPTFVGGAKARKILGDVFNASAALPEVTPQ
jgi:poly-gamma-glutamate capsule biosynthesis protein CapA/YwtB (metallophosphatase superfamily)